MKIEEKGWAVVERGEAIHCDITCCYRIYPEVYHERASEVASACRCEALPCTITVEMERRKGERRTRCRRSYLFARKPGSDFLRSSDQQVALGRRRGQRRKKGE
jgi:hypothetical protein